MDNLMEIGTKELSRRQSDWTVNRKKGAAS